MSEFIAPYILKSEYSCTCCGGLPPDIKTSPLYPLFFKIFKDIREKWGSPIPWNSGYRCLARNKAVGGEEVSVHLFGLAGDLACANVQGVKDLAKVIQSVAPGLRRGEYTSAAKGTFIHIDIGHLIEPRVFEAWSSGVRWTG